MLANWVGGRAYDQGSMVFFLVICQSFVVGQVEIRAKAQRPPYH